MGRAGFSPCFTTRASSASRSVRISTFTPRGLIFKCTARGGNARAAQALMAIAFSFCLAPSIGTGERPDPGKRAVDHAVPASLSLRGGGGVSMDLNDPKILRQLKKNQRQTQAWKSAGPAAAHRNRPKRPTAGEQALTTVESGPLDSEDARRKQLAEQQRRQQILSRLGIRDEEELATVLWKSVERGDIEVFSACVMAGADVQRNYSTVNGKEGINATVLHVAARNNHTHIIPRLCDSFPRPVPFQTSAVCPTATGAG